MAHVSKFGAGAVGNMTAHYRRTNPATLERENIDEKRTHLNREFVPARPEGDAAFIEERIAELDLKRAPRKDAVRMCDWVITKPQSLPDDLTDQFFDEAAVWLANRYGQENVVCASVHMDEATPHMHFAWVPVTDDGRLSAKDILNRQELKRFHGELQEHLQQRLGCPVEILLEDDKVFDKALSAVPHDRLNEARSAATAEIDKIIAERSERLRRVETEIESFEAEPASASIGESAKALIDGTRSGGRESRIRAAIESLRARIRDLGKAIERARERVGELRGRVARAQERVREIKAARAEHPMISVDEAEALLAGQIGTIGDPVLGQEKSRLQGISSRIERSGNRSGPRIGRSR